MTLYGRIVVIKRSGEDGTEFPLTASTCVFGRALECDIRIFIPSVSRKHCYLEIDNNNQILVVPFDDANPTELNQETIVGPVLINHGDVLTISERSFRFEYPPSSPFHSLQMKPPASSRAMAIGSSPGSSSEELKLSTKDISEKSPSKGRHSMPRHSTSGNRKVSFGPYLSPEQYHKRLPPATPVYKGGKPPPRRVSAPDYFGSPLVTPLSNIKRKRSVAPAVGSIKEESPSVVVRSPLSVNNQSPASKSSRKSLGRPVTSSSVGKVRSPHVTRSPLSSKNGGLPSNIASKFSPKKSLWKKTVSSPTALPLEKSVSPAGKSQSPSAASRSSPVKSPLGHFSKSSPGKCRSGQASKSSPAKRSLSRAITSAFVKSPLSKKSPLSNSSILEMLESDASPVGVTPRAKQNSPGTDRSSRTHSHSKKAKSTPNHSAKKKSVSLKLIPKNKRFPFKSTPKSSASKRKGRNAAYPVGVTDGLENPDQLKRRTLSPRENRQGTTSPSSSRKSSRPALLSSPVTSRTKGAIGSPIETNPNLGFSLGKKSPSRPGTEKAKGLFSRSLDESSPAELGGRRSTGKTFESERKRSIVPKIDSPNTPDVRKSKALRNIHASKLRTQSIGKVSAAKGLGSSLKKSANKMSRTAGTLRKPLFSEILKRNLRQNLVARQLVAGVVRSHNSAKALSGAHKATVAGTRYTKNIPTTTTGHANSPETIIIQRKKKIVSAVKTKKGRKTPHKNAVLEHRTTKGKLPKPSPGLNLSGLELLMQTPSPGSKSRRRNLADSSLDFSPANASGISMSVFVSPLSSPKSIKKSDVLGRFLAGGSSTGKQVFPEPSRGDRSDNKSPRKSNSSGTLTGSSGSSKILGKSPLSGIKRLVKSPQKSPTVDYRNVAGLKRLFDQAKGSPKANTSFNELGLARLYSSPEDQRKVASFTRSSSPTTVNRKRRSASNEIPLESTSCEKSPSKRKGYSPKIPSPVSHNLSTFETNDLKVTPNEKGGLVPKTKTPTSVGCILESSHKKASPRRREHLSKTISPRQSIFGYLTERISRSLSPVHKKGLGRTPRTASPFCPDSLQSGRSVKDEASSSSSPGRPVSLALVSPTKGSGSPLKSGSPFKPVSLTSTSPWKSQRPTPKATDFSNHTSPTKIRKMTPIHFNTRKSNLEMSVTDSSISVPVTPSPKIKTSSPKLENREHLSRSPRRNYTEIDQPENLDISVPVTPSPKIKTSSPKLENREHLSRSPRRDYTEIDQPENLDISSSSVKEPKPKRKLRGKPDAAEASLGVVSPTRDATTKARPRRGRAATVKALPDPRNVSVEELPAESNLVNTKVGRKGKRIVQSKSSVTIHSDTKAVSPIQSKKRNRPEMALDMSLSSPEASPIKARKAKMTRKGKYDKLLTSLNSPDAASVTSPRLRGKAAASPSLGKSKARNIGPETKSPSPVKDTASPKVLSKLRRTARTLGSKASPAANPSKRKLRGGAIEPLSKTPSPVKNTVTPAKLKRTGRTNPGKSKGGPVPEEGPKKAASPVKVRASSRAKVTAPSPAGGTPKGRQSKLRNSSPPTRGSTVQEVTETLPKLPEKRGSRSATSNSKRQKLESPNKEIQSPVGVGKKRSASQRKTTPKKHIPENDISSDDGETIEIKPRTKLGRPKKETKKAVAKSKKPTKKDKEQAAAAAQKLKNLNLSPIVELMDTPRISPGKGPKTPPPRRPRGQPTPSTRSPEKTTRPSRRAPKRK